MTQVSRRWSSESCRLGTKQVIMHETDSIHRYYLIRVLMFNLWRSEIAFTCNVFLPLIVISKIITISQAQYNALFSDGPSLYHLRSFNTTYHVVFIYLGIKNTLLRNITCWKIVIGPFSLYHSKCCIDLTFRI